MASDSGKNAQANNERTPPEVPDLDLIRPVGHGGFGEVWLATNRTTGHLRAVKVIPLQQASETDPAAREIASLTRLEANLERQHPNLLNIHHVGKTDQCLFYVMDLADDATGGPATSEPDYRPATLQSQLQGAPLSPSNAWTMPANSSPGWHHSMRPAWSIATSNRPIACSSTGN